MKSRAVEAAVNRGCKLTGRELTAFTVKKVKEKRLFAAIIQCVELYEYN